ncbi:MAG: histidine kinase [Bacteroidales bacterium]|nr:histidine kinase [Bacteroidales bacterium]
METNVQEKAISRKRPGFFGDVKDNGLYSLLNIILFSVLAEAAYVAVLFLTDVLKRCMDGDAFSFAVFIINPFLFNILCFALLRINKAANNRYPFRYYSSSGMLLFFLLIGLAFGLYNYGLYVAAVASVGSDGSSPFIPTEPIWLQLGLITISELIIMCLISLNHTARYTIRLYEESEELKQTQARAEIQALQTQLNPHFLFNSLNTLVSEIDYDAAAAKKFTIDLAGVYRYILQKQNKPLVAVFEELDFLQAYINLNKIRVGQSLHYSCEYPEISNLDFLQEKYIPSLSLQLLVENALKHNVVSSMKPLDIKVGFSEDLRYLIVSNNLNPKKNVQSLGTGLGNLSKRYLLLAGKEIVVEKNLHSFIVKLPMLDGNQTGK